MEASVRSERVKKGPFRTRHASLSAEPALKSRPVRRGAFRVTERRELEGMIAKQSRQSTSSVVARAPRGGPLPALVAARPALRSPAPRSTKRQKS